MDEPTVMCLRSETLIAQPEPFTKRRPDPPNHAHLLPGSAPYSGAESRGRSTSLTVGTGWLGHFRSPAHPWCLWAESNHHHALTRREHDLHATEAEILVIPLSFVFGDNGTKQFALDDSAFALCAIEAIPVHCQIDLACLAHAIAWS